MATGPRLERLFALMAARGDAMAIAELDTAYRYAALLKAIDDAGMLLDEHGVNEGDVIGLQAAFSLSAVALALAAFRRNAVVAFLSPSVAEPETLLKESCAGGLFTIGTSGDPEFRSLARSGSHPLLDGLRERAQPGFIIFSSGSSGRPKAILHDLEQYLAAYETARKPLTTLAFLLFDHIAGLDTLFYTLHAGGALVFTNDRSPAAICRLIDRWRVEVLPVSPSFLKLLCLSGVPDGIDLASLRIITYGSEPIDAATLERVEAIFPNVALRQKYGASEFGAPRARTREGDGLWIRLDSDTVEVRVDDGILWLRTPTTMLGYLNADAPPTKNGWFCTGDRVEVDGPWMRILGRQSDMINVGGEKVFPSEVEGVIQELDTVAEVAVSGEPHALLGQTVTALIRPTGAGADIAELRRSVRTHCLQRLARHKVPIKILFADHAITNERQKVIRNIPL